MLDWKRLIHEHGDWEEYNFPNEPLLHVMMGVQEEIGELTHHYLKMRQKIRGTPEHHVSEMQDAVGDTTVYLLGVMRRLGLDGPYEMREPVTADDPDRLILLLGCHMSYLSGAVLHVGEGRLITYAVSKLITGLRRWCRTMGWDYERIVEDTWSKVKRRDWQADPHKGVDTRAMDLLREKDDGPYTPPSEVGGPRDL